MGKTTRLDSTVTAVGAVELRAFVASLAAVGDDADDDAARIDQLALLEQIGAACVAAQARVMVAFADSQREQQAAAGVPVRERGRGVADQIGLACKISPQAASSRLGRARTLMADLPRVYDELSAGLISDRAADAVVRQTTHLSQHDRRAVDAVIAPHLVRMSAREAQDAVRRLAIERDPESACRRAEAAAAERGVWARPAPDAMVKLTAMLPAADGVTSYAALDRAARAQRAAGDECTLAQLRADLLTERLTGRSVSDGADVEISLVMTAGALLDDADEPATLRGHGPVPAALARAIAAGTGTAKARAWVRRLFADPVTGVLDSLDPRRRIFDRHVRRHLDARDQTCRTPFCDSAIRHRDHVTAYADGGATDAANGQGMCERGNYAKQVPGWRARVVADSPHTVTTATPTGHTYRSTAPPALGAGADLTRRHQRPRLVRLTYDDLRDDPDAVTRLSDFIRRSA
ncbi:DUF222 domain-containing protein [Luteipulveratus halotolerans]|uniref:DUF222 domain-containing protein n=1 Tax=Luteipulveratus halotolerans TaxID=1631356 RepID=UPI000681B52B|nr:DUF222 domain-containing protein [Luteipulveratus halotolerans]